MSSGDSKQAAASNDVVEPSNMPPLPTVGKAAGSGSAEPQATGGGDSKEAAPVKPTGANQSANTATEAGPDDSPTGGAPEDEDAEDAGDDNDFVKTLDSDVKDSEAFTLLMEVKRTKPDYYADFSEENMRCLAQYFSVLEFDTGDQIIQSGEPATFMGIILDGTYEVSLYNLTVVLERGSLVGEMNFFDGGVRTASVRAASPGVIAVITYVDMRQLQYVAPDLMIKFTTMLAQGTIKVLKRINDRQKRQVLMSKASSLIARARASHMAHDKGTAAAAPRKSVEVDPRLPLPPPQSAEQARRRSMSSKQLDEHALVPVEMEAAVLEEVEEEEEEDDDEDEEDSDNNDDTSGKPSNKKKKERKKKKTTKKKTKKKKKKSVTSNTADEEAPAQRTMTANAAHKQEILYRSRLAQQEKEKKEIMEKETKKRKKAENKARTHRYQVINRDNRIRLLQDELKKNHQEIVQLRRYQKTAQAQIEEDKKFTQDMLEHKAELQKQIEHLEAEREALKKDKEDLTRQLAATEDSKVSELREELERVKTKLRETTLQLNDAKQTHETKHEKLTEQVNYFRARRESVLNRFDAYKRTLDYLERLMTEHESQMKSQPDGTLDKEQQKEHMAYIKREVEKLIVDPNLREHAVQNLELRDRLHHMEAHVNRLMGTLTEREAKISELDRARIRAVDQTVELQKTLEKQLQRESDEIASLSESLHSYRLLLKRMAVFQYVNVYKQRTTMRGLYGQLIDMAVEMLSDVDRESTIEFRGKQSAEARQRHQRARRILREVSAVNLAHLQRHGGRRGVANESANTGASGQGQPQNDNGNGANSKPKGRRARMLQRMVAQQRQKLRQKRKPASFLRELHDLGDSIVDVSGRMKLVFEETQFEKLYWKKMANDMLARSIELKKEKNEVEQQVAVLLKQKELLQRVVDKMYEDAADRGHPFAPLTKYGRRASTSASVELPPVVKRNQLSITTSSPQQHSDYADVDLTEDTTSTTADERDRQRHSPKRRSRRRAPRQQRLHVRADAGTDVTDDERRDQEEATQHKIAVLKSRIQELEYVVTSAGLQKGHVVAGLAAALPPHLPIRSPRGPRHQNYIRRGGGKKGARKSPRKDRKGKKDNANSKDDSSKAKRGKRPNFNSNAGFARFSSPRDVYGYMRKPKATATADEHQVAMSAGLVQIYKHGDHVLQEDHSVAAEQSDDLPLGGIGVGPGGKLNLSMTGSTRVASLDDHVHSPNTQRSASSAVGGGHRNNNHFLPFVAHSRQPDEEFYAEVFQPPPERDQELL